MIRLLLISLVCTLGILGPVSGALAQDNPNASLRLYRAVHWKAVGSPDSEYTVFKGREFYQALPANLIAIDTIWWLDEGPRMETIFMQNIRLEDGLRMHARVDFQKNDFPMDSNWDVLWSRRIVFELDRPFIFYSRILKMDYRVTIYLTKAK